MRLERPRDEVYRYWRSLENLPGAMGRLQRVTERDDGTSRWSARGPGRIPVEWDAELVEDVENERIAWRSLAGSDIATEGAVTFTAVRNGRSTEVVISLSYMPRGGRATALLARLAGHDPAKTLREDLRRVKAVLEAGEIPRAVMAEDTSRRQS